MKKVSGTILVNMPSCKNLLFTLDKSTIINSKKIKLENSIKANVFYSLSEELQIKINLFLNPNSL